MRKANGEPAERTPLLWHVLAVIAVLLSWLGVGGMALFAR
jgi:hypothetical protein